MECNDLNVDEGAFWHTNMDLYYGHQLGEVVEVEHEANKYWLAVIEYSFKHLMLLRWVGDYGEFWIDTSLQNSATNSSASFNHQTNITKRLYPLGHHMQYQLKSQYLLEKPLKALVKPSFYDPAKDPYAEIKTVDDLLAYEAHNANETLMNPDSLTDTDTNLALAKCKIKISYGQEDVYELEAALQNLEDIDPIQNQRSNESPDDFNNLAKEEQKLEPATCDIRLESSEDSGIPSSQSESSKSNHDGSKQNSDHEISIQKLKEDGANDKALENVSLVHDEENRELCENLQTDANYQGKYNGIGKYSNKVFYLKPKQFYDLGGANHEKVFVPGTVLEICHIPKKFSRTSPPGDSAGCEPKLCHWFATVIKNIGGRLTLRWFLSDEPKFKQGRLELKSIKSKFVFENADLEPSEATTDQENAISIPMDKISAKDITFCMHFCNPCIFTIGAGKEMNRTYKFPEEPILDFFDNLDTEDTAELLQKTLIDAILDPRRMNLDKDRPIIDHLLEFSHKSRPKFVDIKYGEQEGESRNVLLTCPKLTRVFKGFINRQLDEGVFEVFSEPLSDSGEIIKFVYPYDYSYTILPVDWAKDNSDCLSVQPSRNPTPTPNNKPSNEDADSNSDNLKSENNISDATSEAMTNDIKNESIEHETPEDKTNDESYAEPKTSQENQDETITERQSQSSGFTCRLVTDSAEIVNSTFHVMQQLEVTHPSSDVTICSGRIRKVAYPLLWIQISAGSYTLLPFNSTEIYANGWCEANDHSLMSLLPPRKRLNNSQDKKRKKVKLLDERDSGKQESDDQTQQEYEIEDFNFDAIGPVDYVLPDRATLTQIFFNHKCFTGPSLSKGKICSLPQYVGPGPLRLVIEEVMTKVISVAYVPPRILNDLSSKSFRDLLVARNMTNTIPMEFKAKYQKRVHRELVPVCISSNDVARYCECVCEHLKCCYNLFGPNLYDGDDCPGHCRALTKSNKFMKRATYYREKARNGEFINDNNSAKKSTLKSSTRARYAGRDSSESTSSTVSRSDQVNSRASSAGDEVPLVNDVKENLAAVQEGPDEEPESQPTQPQSDLKAISTESESNNKTASANEDDAPLKYNRKFERHMNNGSEFQLLGTPEDWTIEDVADHMSWTGLAKFRPQMISEGIDGRALLLLDRAAIREHFQHQQKLDFTFEEVGKLCRFVEYVKARVEGLSS